MSLVGNFAFNNFDRTAETGGTPSLGGQAFVRRNSRANEHEEERHELGLKKTTSRQSEAQTRKHSISEDPEKAEIGKHNDFGRDGIRGDTYYPDGIPPADTPATRNEDLEKKDDDIMGDSSSDDQREKAVLKLARTITDHSTRSSSGKNPFEFEKDSVLDPHSPNFKARAWAKAMLSLQSRDPEKFPTRTAGIAYKNLNVFGYGVATDYQKSVSNIVLEVLGVWRSILKIGRRRIDILRDFEGLVESGEMLVVLGPPGSGCSTLLKTIAGETHGIFVDDRSYINYQGKFRPL